MSGRRQPTIGVAASGLNVPYPSENVALKARILSQGGLLLSEYPPDMQSSKYVFAVRNRILAGLGHAVVLMEARIRSGSMLTVHHALDQGKGCVRLSGHSGRARCPKGRINSCGKAQSTSQVRRIFLEDMDWQPAASIPKRQDTGQPRPAPPKKETQPAPAKAPKAPPVMEQKAPPPEPPKTPEIPLPPMERRAEADLRCLGGR